jgi:hypothetical protein
LDGKVNSTSDFNENSIELVKFIKWERKKLIIFIFLQLEFIVAGPTLFAVFFQDCGAPDAIER